MPCLKQQQRQQQQRQQQVGALRGGAMQPRSPLATLTAAAWQPGAMRAVAFG
jgi:hypothetical protein